MHHYLSIVRSKRIVIRLIAAHTHVSQHRQSLDRDWVDIQLDDCTDISAILAHKEGKCEFGIHTRSLLLVALVLPLVTFQIQFCQIQASDLE
jgi:ABC-type phosphate transport system permease subunit